MGRLKTVPTCEASQLWLQLPLALPRRNDRRVLGPRDKALRDFHLRHRRGSVQAVHARDTPRQQLLRPQRGYDDELEGVEVDGTDYHRGRGAAAAWLAIVHVPSHSRQRHRLLTVITFASVSMILPLQNGQVAGFVAGSALSRGSAIGCFSPLFNSAALDRPDLFFCEQSRQCRSSVPGKPEIDSPRPCSHGMI